MPGGGSANNHDENDQGVPAHHQGQAGVPAAGAQGPGVHNHHQDDAPAQQPGHGAANHGIPEQQVLSVWGDLTQTQEDRVRNQYTVYNMDSVKVEDEEVMGYRITNFFGKRPGK